MKNTLILASALIIFAACYDVTAAYKVNTIMEASLIKVSEVLDECVVCRVGGISYLMM